MIRLRRERTGAFLAAADVETVIPINYEILPKGRAGKMGGGNQAGLSATHRKDAMKAAPDHHSILLENDQVRVLDTRLRPGEHTPIHTHEWPGALYVLSWSDFIRRDADGNIMADSRAMRSSPRPGDSLW